MVVRRPLVFVVPIFGFFDHNLFEVGEGGENGRTRSHQRPITINPWGWKGGEGDLVGIGKEKKGGDLLWVSDHDPFPLSRDLAFQTVPRGGQIALRHPSGKLDLSFAKDRAFDRLDILGGEGGFTVGSTPDKTFDKSLSERNQHPVSFFDRIGQVFRYAVGKEPFGRVLVSVDGDFGVEHSFILARVRGMMVGSENGERSARSERGAHA